MTISLAALCTFNGEAVVVGASDCMLTVGDVEFEPPRSKVSMMGNRTIVLIAGDMADQTPIILETAVEHKKNDQMPTPQIAEIYAKAFQNFRRKQAEAKYLAPLGLDIKSFIANKSKMNDYLIEDLAHKLQGHRLDTSAIIAGVDEGGGHLYVIEDPGVVTCYDSIAFCAIGTGAFHAQSEFMFSKYTKMWSLGNAMYLSYMAKKRAENAPGVGQETFMICLGLNSDLIVLNQLEIALFNKIYQQLMSKRKAIDDEMYKNVQEHIEKSLASIINPTTPEPPKRD